MLLSEAALFHSKIVRIAYIPIVLELLPINSVVLVSLGIKLIRTV